MAKHTQSLTANPSPSHTPASSIDDTLQPSQPQAFLAINHFDGDKKRESKPFISKWAETEPDPNPSHLQLLKNAIYMRALVANNELYPKLH